MSTLLLSLCAVTVIQLTSSQSTYDVIQQDSCEHNTQLLYQLQKDMGELKAAIGHKRTNGMWLRCVILGHGTCNQQIVSSTPGYAMPGNNSSQVVHTQSLQCALVIKR